jgi:hypothetical protein
MANYSFASVTHCNDSALSVSYEEIEVANAQVEADLLAKGIDPADITLPNTLLKMLAVNYALNLCATRNIAGEDSPLADKSRLYRQAYLDGKAGLSRAALGLGVAKTWVRSVNVMRG